MALKTAGQLKISEIEGEFDLGEEVKNYKISALAEEAGLSAPHSFSEFYGMSSGPREFFASFSIEVGQHTHTLQWSIVRDDQGEPNCNVYVYGKIGETVDIEDEDNLLSSEDGIPIGTNVFQHQGGYNKSWTYRLVLENDRGFKESEPRFIEAIPTPPSFDAALQCLRDPDEIGTDAAQKTVSVVFDLTDDIPFTEGYNVEIYYKVNENQDFAQVDPTISRSTAINAENPVTANFGEETPELNKKKSVLLSGLSFDLFVRYSVLLYLHWTGQEASARGVIDFAGERPNIPIVGVSVGPDSIQLSWQHDNKSIKYEVYYHIEEIGVAEDGRLLFTSAPADGEEHLTTLTHKIGYNRGGWYVVKAFTEFSEAQSSPKRADTLISKPALDGSISLLRDPYMAGYNGQGRVQVSWDMADDGPDYSDGYECEFYIREQDSTFADLSMTRENADNANTPVKVVRYGKGPQTFLITK